MPALVLKDIPDMLHIRLKEQAERNHRSVSHQALIILEHGVQCNQPDAHPLFLTPFKGRVPLTDKILSEARKERQ